MEFKIVSPDEIHIIVKYSLNISFITVDGSSYDLVQLNTDPLTKFKTYMFCKNYYKDGKSTN